MRLLPLDTVNVSVAEAPGSPIRLLGDWVSWRYQMLGVGTDGHEPLTAGETSLKGCDLGGCNGGSRKAHGAGGGFPLGLEHEP